MRIFISYQTLDGAVAKSVADEIRAKRANTETFFAPETLSAGAYWLPRLAQEIKDSDAVVLLIGKRVGKWQELEYLEAVRLARETGQPLIIPVVMSDCAPGLPFFNQYHRLFFREPASREAIAAILKALDGAPRDGASPLWAQFNPYRGLAAFTSADAGFFFGREALTAKILTLMQSEPSKVLALIGSSGVGKSSLAQAGVIAALKRQEWPTEGVWPVALGESRSWMPLTIRPEDKPLKSLALTFTQLLHERSSDQDADAEGWVRQFRDGGGFADLMRAVKDKLAQNLASDAPRSFFLYIDQAEELYASTEREGKFDASAKRDAEIFSRVIAEAASFAHCRVLLTLRSDYYGQLQGDETLFAASRRVDVPPMSVAALCEAIERPTGTLGVRFEPAAMPSYIAGATAREAGALPLLAYLLSDMWREMQGRGDGVMRFVERPEVFDVSAALRDRAERFLAQNQPRERDLRRLFTLRLTQVPRLGDVIKRRARRAECSAEEWNIAEELAKEDWRLVVLEGGSGEVTAEVAHEQLLRKWPALEGWLGELRDFLTWKADLEAARAAYDETPSAEKPSALLTGRGLLIARNWLASHEDDLANEDRAFVKASIKADDELRERLRAQEHKILMRTRIGAGVAATLFLIAAIIGWWALTQRKVAEMQTDEAQRQKTIAELQRHDAEKLRAEAEEQKSIAQQQLKEAQINKSRYLSELSVKNIETGDTQVATVLALQSVPIITEEKSLTRPLVKNAVQALYRALSAPAELLVLQENSGLRIENAQLGEDGGLVVLKYNDNSAKAYNHNGEVVTEIRNADAHTLDAIAFSPNSKTLIAAYYSHGYELEGDAGNTLERSRTYPKTTIVFYNSNDNKELYREDIKEKRVASITFSPDSRQSVVCGEGCYVYSTRENKGVSTLNAGGSVVSSSFNTQGKLFTTLAKTGRISVFDANTWELQKSTDSAGQDIIDSTFYQNSEKLLVAGTKDVKVYDSSSLNLLDQFSIDSDYKRNKLSGESLIIFYDETAFSRNIVSKISSRTMSGVLDVEPKRGIAVRKTSELGVKVYSGNHEISYIQAPNGDYIQAATIISSKNVLATFHQSGLTRIWRIDTGALLGTIQGRILQIDKHERFVLTSHLRKFHLYDLNPLRDRKITNYNTNDGDHVNVSQVGHVLALARQKEQKLFNMSVIDIRDNSSFYVDSISKYAATDISEAYFAYVTPEQIIRILKMGDKKTFDIRIPVKFRSIDSISISVNGEKVSGAVVIDGCLYLFDNSSRFELIASGVTHALIGANNERTMLIDENNNSGFGFSIIDNLTRLSIVSSDPQFENLQNSKLTEAFFCGYSHNIYVKDENRIRWLISSYDGSVAEWEPLRPTYSVSVNPLTCKVDRSIIDASGSSGIYDTEEIDLDRDTIPIHEIYSNAKLLKDIPNEQAALIVSGTNIELVPYYQNISGLIQAARARASYCLASASVISAAALAQEPISCPIAPLRP